MTSSIKTLVEELRKHPADAFLVHPNERIVLHIGTARTLCFTFPVVIRVSLEDLIDAAGNAPAPTFIVGTGFAVSSRTVTRKMVPIRVRTLGEASFALSPADPPPPGVTARIRQWAKSFGRRRLPRVEVTAQEVDELVWQIRTSQSGISLNP